MVVKTIRCLEYQMFCSELTWYFYCSKTKNNAFKSGKVPIKSPFFCFARLKSKMLTSIFQAGGNIEHLERQLFIVAGWEGARGNTEGLQY